MRSPLIDSTPGPSTAPERPCANIIERLWRPFERWTLPDRANLQGAFPLGGRLANASEEIPARSATRATADLSTPARDLWCGDAFLAKRVFVQGPITLARVRVPRCTMIGRRAKDGVLLQQRWKGRWKPSHSAASCSRPKPVSALLFARTAPKSRGAIAYFLFRFVNTLLDANRVAIAYGKAACV